MTEFRDFPTGDVISAATGYLVTPSGIGAIYELLSWMTGEDVFTHQLPRIGKEAQPVILAQHPPLAEAYAEVENVTPANWQEFHDRWVQRYGPTLCVPKLDRDQHERIDPLSELAQRVHPSKIIVVEGA